MNIVRTRRPWRWAVLGLVLLASLAASVLPTRATVWASTPTAQGPSMEAIHASYLDLTGNITDLRSRVAAWQKGDDASLNIAGEKLDRIRVILASVAWPPALAPAIAKTQAAVEPMAMALKAKDAMMADAPAKQFGDASHDLTHAFYGNWLPGLKGMQFTNMAPHAAYLDLSANIADLRTRVTQWQGGDEGSLNVAKEKVDRINVLVQHMSTFGVLAQPLQALTTAMSDVSMALDMKDPAAAQDALKPVGDAAHNLTHGFYTWLNATAGPHDPDCVQASYLDLSLNVADLRTRIGDWQKGDANGLTIGQEKLDRVQAVLKHVAWPSTMGAAIAATQAVVQPLGQAFKDKDVAAVAQPLKALGDASHNVTHAYYGNWLATAHSGAHMASGAGNSMDNMGAMPAAGNAAPAASSSMIDESKPHSHGDTAVSTTTTSAATKRFVLGGFGTVNALLIAAAAVLKIGAKRQAAAKAAANAAARTETALGEGAAE